MAKKKKSSGNSAASIVKQLQQLSNEATEKSFQYNTQEANTARAWQEQMSNTAHQREVEDLKKAGLNPVLASNTGAQSYTTSSASAQAENAASAVGNVWSSDISARATRAAAAQSAAATRYAANAQAAAARYAASMQYQASIYHSDRAKEASNYAADAKERATKYQTDHAKTGTLYGILSNGLGSFGKGLVALGKGQVNKIDKLFKNPENYLKNTSKGFSANNLNVAGRQFVNRQLKQWNVGTSNKVYKMYVNAFLKRDAGAMKKWTKYVNGVYTKRNSAAQNVISRRFLLQ